MHGKKLFLFACLLLCSLLVTLPAAAESEPPFVPLWAPGGDQVLLADSSSLSPAFWLVTAKSRDWRKAPLAFVPSAARWSPDGKTLAYAAAGQVALLNSDSLENRMLRTLKNSPAGIQGLAWSPSGDRLAVLYLSPAPAVQVANIDDTAAATITLPLPEGANTTAMLVWSPDGQRLALVSLGGAWVSDLRPGPGPAKWTSLLQDEALVIDLLWAPDSRHMILTAATDLFGNNMELILTAADAAYWKPVLSGPAVQAVAWGSKGDALLCADLSEGRAGVLTGLIPSKEARVSWLSGIQIKKSAVPGLGTLAALILPPEIAASSAPAGGAWNSFNLGRNVLIRDPRSAGLWWPETRTTVEEDSLNLTHAAEIWALQGEPGDFERLLAMLARGTPALSPDGKYLALSGNGDTPAQILTVAANPAADSRTKNDTRHNSFLFRPVTWFAIMVVLIAVGVVLTIRLRRKKFSPRS